MTERVIVGPGDFTPQVGQQSFEQVAQQTGFFVGEINLHVIDTVMQNSQCKMQTVRHGLSS